MNATNDETTTTNPPEIADRYRARDADGDSVEIYDDENDDAWIRSDLTLDVGRPN